MANQNQYRPQTVAMDGGLDYINPKITIPSGTLNGCLNFERTDRVGYSRIFGFEQFDGGIAPSLAYTNLAYITHDTVTPPAPTRTELWINPDGPVMGAIVSGGATKSLIAVTNFDQWRLVLKAVNAFTTISLTDAAGNTYTVSAVQDFSDGYKQANPTPVPNAKIFTEARNQYFKNMNATVDIPGNPNKPVIGLHGYKDQIYAIKDLTVVYFTDGNEEIFSNDQIKRHGVAGNHTVYSVVVLTGSFAGGDATGLLLVDSHTLTNGAYDLIRPQTQTDNVLNLADAPDGTDLTAWAAGMYRSNDYVQAQAAGMSRPGWSSVDLGYYFSFAEGSQYGPPRIYRRGKFSVFTTDVFDATGVATVAATTDSEEAGNPIPGDSWSFTGSDLVDSCNTDNQTSKYIERIINNSFETNQIDPGNLNLSNFTNVNTFSTTTGLNVKGMKVTIRCRGTPLTANFSQMSIGVQPLFNGALAPNTTSKSENIEQNFTPGGFPAPRIQYLTFGGETDLWGVDDVTFKGFMDTTFGLQVQPWVAMGSSDIRQGKIDMFYIAMTIYFTQDITDYYFWNGSDDVTAKITNVFTDPGEDPTANTWALGTAEGTIQVIDIQPVGSADREYISDGDEIRTAPGGAGLLVATVTEDMIFNGLDTLAEIQEADSRYQFITQNFYADEDFEGMYGVSGAGRAFSYDGFYFDRIYTQADDDKDKPRHVTNHQFHLMLGYRSGAVLGSVAGNPQDFNGLNGAVEIDIGDDVIGFSKMQGTTLGVFGSKTIFGLVGTSPDNFSLTLLSPYEGGIEYTICDVGGRAVYCSYRGISFFDQTAAYGDFAGQRLSYAITPFLVPRIQGTVAPLGSVATSAGPIVAIPCRTKNQYRLYFADGGRITMTLAGAEQRPMFTYQSEALIDGDGNYLGYVVPRAESSFVDSTGAERIHIAPYSEAVTMDDGYYVYEYEHSWTFNGAGIAAYIITNENFYGSLFDFDIARKLRIHGVSLGYAPIRVRLGKNYDPNTNTLQVPRESVVVSLPNTPADDLSIDYNPTTSLGNVSTRGRSFSMRFMSYDIENQSDTAQDPVYADVCPPFVIQAMLVQDTDAKGDI